MLVIHEAISWDKASNFGGDFALTVLLNIRSWFYEILKTVVSVNFYDVH